MSVFCSCTWISTQTSIYKLKQKQIKGVLKDLAVLCNTNCTRNCEWTIFAISVLVGVSMFYASAERFYKISTKKCYLLILTTARHNQQQVKGLRSHLWRHQHAVKQVLVGLPGASRLWKASLEPTCCEEVQAGLHTLPPTIFFHF